MPDRMFAEWNYIMGIALGLTIAGLWLWYASREETE